MTLINKLTKLRLSEKSWDFLISKGCQATEILFDVGVNHDTKICIYLVDFLLQLDTKMETNLNDTEHHEVLITGSGNYSECWKYNVPKLYAVTT